MLCENVQEYNLKNSIIYQDSKKLETIFLKKLKGLNFENDESFAKAQQREFERKMIEECKIRQWSVKLIKTKDKKVSGCYKDESVKNSFVSNEESNDNFFKNTNGNSVHSEKMPRT